MTTTWVVLVLAHLVFTAVMTGLIWMVHLVHYPLFAHVGAEDYRTYQSEHMRRISWLLAVPWVAEVALGALIFAFAPNTTLRIVTFIAGAVQVGVALVTGFVAAPAHGRLLEGFDTAEHRGLMRANLVRTLLWTVRLGFAVAIVWLSVDPRA